MYVKLRMELRTDSIDYKKSSVFQGILMEQIDPEYAEKLHQSKLHPYSQYLLKEKETLIWNICTLDEEAYEKIIIPLSKLNELELKKYHLNIPIASKQISMIQDQELLDHFYNKEGERYLNIHFLSPTAFKKDGKYVNFPDLRLIYQSLMRKYTNTSVDMSMEDQDTLEEMVNKSEICGYRLQTVAFPLEKVHITGFIGKITIRLNGTDTMSRYIRLLFEYGEYSGVGIKTGIGMGAIRYERRENIWMKEK